MSCGSTSRPIAKVVEVSDNPHAEAAFREARAAFEAGRLDEAEGRLLALMDRFPADPLVKPSVLLRARIALAKGQPQAARDLLTPLMSGSGPVAERAKLFDAVALRALGHPAEAFDELRPFVGRLTDPAETAILVEHLVGAALDMGLPAKALTPLARLLGYQPEPQVAEQLMAQVDECLSRISSADQLANVLEDLPSSSVVLAVATARFARLAIDEGEPDVAKRAIQLAVEAGHGQSSSLMRLLEELASGADVELETIGCILPMSGRSRLVGEQALRGVMLGADRVALRPDGSHMTVILRDDAGDPDKARAAVRTLVQDEKVAAIIGPLDAACAAAAAQEAEKLGVPLLLLSSRESQTPTTTALRPFTSHRAEVRALLARARAADAGRVVLFVPDSDYGKLVAGLTKQEATSRSLPEPSVVFYAKDATSFGSQVSKVAGLSPEAVLLADSASKIALLAPALAAAGLWSTLAPTSLPRGASPIQLLVTSPGWSMDLARRAGRYLQGALFASYYEPWLSPVTESFAALYANEYAAAPGFIAALGHDAAVLLGGALQAAPQNRKAIRDWLVRQAPGHASDLPLATPFAGFAADTGEPLANPALLRFEGTEFSLAP